MLLLSRGLVLSFRDLLDAAGFDIRVLASDAPPFSGPLLTDATALSRAIGRLPEVEAVLQLRLRDAEMVGEGAAIADGAPSPADAASRLGRDDRVQFIGVDPQARSMWTMVSGQDLPRTPAPVPALVVNRDLAREASLGPGSRGVAALRRRRESAAGGGLRDLRSGRLSLRRCGGADDGGHAAGCGDAVRRRGPRPGRDAAGPVAPRPRGEHRGSGDSGREPRPVRRHQRGSGRAVQPSRVLATSARSRRCCPRSRCSSASC